MHISPEQIQNLSWLEAAQRSRTPKTPKIKTFGLFKASATQTAAFKLNPRHNIPSYLSSGPFLESIQNLRQTGSSETRPQIYLLGTQILQRTSSNSHLSHEITRHRKQV
jgi:hypothetical protein